MNQHNTYKIDNIIITFMGVLVLSIIIVIVSYYIGLPEILFGVYDSDGNLLKTNNINGEFIKLVGLFIGGSIAIWGLWINNKRVKIQNKQIELQTEQIILQRQAQEKVTKQIEISERAQENVLLQIQIAKGSQIHTRFKDAALLFASKDVSSVRSGLYALHQIVIDVSRSDNIEYKGYIKVICEILSSYIREEWRMSRPPLTEDFNEQIKRVEILHTIFGLMYSKEMLYRADKAMISLLALFIEDSVFMDNVFYYTYFTKSRFKNVQFNTVTFKNVNFVLADLTNVSFSNCKLIQVDFSYSTLSMVDFSNTILEGYSMSELSKEGRSLELTHPSRVEEWNRKKNEI